MKRCKKHNTSNLHRNTCLVTAIVLGIIFLGALVFSVYCIVFVSILITVKYTGEGWAHNSIFVPPLFIEETIYIYIYNKPTQNWVVMYLCAKVVDFASLLRFFYRILKMFRHFCIFFVISLYISMHSVNNYFVLSKTGSYTCLVFVKYNGSRKVNMFSLTECFFVLKTASIYVVHCFIFAFSRVHIGSTFDNLQWYGIT